MEPMKPMAPMAPMTFDRPWWPTELGDPSSSGSQNGARYAFFPQRRRLLIEQDGETIVYDSAEHEISGVSQQSGRSSSMVFTSQSGPVALDTLRRVEGG